MVLYVIISCLVIVHYSCDFSLILVLFKIISTQFTLIFIILTVNQYMEVMKTNVVLILALAYATLDLITFQYSKDTRF